MRVSTPTSRTLTLNRLNKLKLISRENNFDLVRLIAALEVAIGHTVDHLRCRKYFDIEGIEIDVPFPGVFCFFVISGFLIASSYERNPQFKSYIRNRLLRIVPALWIAFILVCLVLGYFGFLNGETLTTPQFLMWVIGQLTVFQYYTPDALRPFGVSCPNGSLWTIPIEFLFYLLLPVLFYIFRKRKNLGLIMVSVCSIVINVLLAQFNDGGIFYKLLGVSVLPWLYCFLMGSIMYLNWDKIKRYIEGKALIYGIIYFLFVNFFSEPSNRITSFSILIANFLLAIMTISLAYTKPKLGRLLHGVDISYGLYVYHMIIVNIFVQLKLVGEISYVLIALLISICMAVLSWIYVESKVLKLKKY